MGLCVHSIRSYLLCQFKLWSHFQQFVANVVRQSDKVSFTNLAFCRSLDKLKHELSELVPTSKSAGSGDSGMFGKRPRLDSPRSSSAGFSSKSHTPSPTPPGSATFDSKGHNNSSGSSEAEEMAMGVELDMNLEGLGDCTCCICKSFNQESGNKLMECHTCQNLFHQGCHDPPVSNEEANDPRLVWNCSECLRKQVGNDFFNLYCLDR